VNYALSVDADFDLDDIWEYIAADSIDAADRWIGKLFDAIEALGQTPGMGHRREDLTSYREGSRLPRADRTGAAECLRIPDESS
jgi:plasmid stabilization system protein ParE